MKRKETPIQQMVNIGNTFNQAELIEIYKEAMKTFPTKNNVNHERNRMKTQKQQHYITYLKVAKHFGDNFYENVKGSITKEIGIPNEVLTIIQSQNNTKINKKNVINVFEGLLKKYHERALKQLGGIAQIGTFNGKNEVKEFYNALKRIDIFQNIEFDYCKLNEENSNAIYNFQEFLCGFDEGNNQTRQTVKKQKLKHDQRPETSRYAQRRAEEQRRRTQEEYVMSSFKNYQPTDRMTKAQLIQKILTKVRSLRKDKLKRFLSKLSRIEGYDPISPIKKIGPKRTTSMTSKGHTLGPPRKRNTVDTATSRYTPKVTKPLPSKYHK